MLFSQPACAFCSASLLPTPNVGNYANALSAISGTSSSDVWAVGSYLSGAQAGHQPLVEHFDGNAWSVVPLAMRQMHRNALLFSVSAFSPSDAWAVGQTGQPCETCHPNLPFVAHWNGGAWSEVPIPAINWPFSKYLVGVSIDPANPANVWFAGNAVHGDIRGEEGFGFADDWVTRLPAITYYFTRANRSPFISGVAAAADGEVWIVGQEFGPAGYWSIEHFDGRSWAPQQSVGSYDHLAAVGASSPSNVWAVGSRIEYYDGQTWHDSVKPVGSQLNALSVLGASDVWAAGYAGTVLHLDGTSWEAIRQPGLSTATFTGVYGFQGGAITAGFIGRGNHEKTVSTLTVCH